MKCFVGSVRSSAGRMAPKVGTAEGAREKSCQMWSSGISSAICKWCAAWSFLIRVSLTCLEGLKVRSARGRWMGVSRGCGNGMFGGGDGGRWNSSLSTGKILIMWGQFDKVMAASLWR